MSEEQKPEKIIDGDYTVVDGRDEPFFLPGGLAVVLQILFWSVVIVLWKAWPYL